MAKWIRLSLELWGVEIDVLAAHVERNPIYRMEVEKRIKPLELAITLGRVSQEKADRLWAEVYAETVIVGSPTEKLREFDNAQWVEWLLEDLERFWCIRRYAMAEENFPNADEGFRAKLGSID